MTNLKKATIASIVILVLIIGVAIASFAITSGTANKDAKLRKTASNDSIVLEIIPKKDEVEILEDAGDWYKVNYKKIKGYVQKEFIDVIEESSEIDTTEDKTEENQVDLKKGDTTLAKTEIKLYVRPLINSRVITKIEKSKQIVIEEIRNGWAYVNVDGIAGWVRLDSLKLAEQDSKVTQTDNQENNNTKTETTALNKTAYISSTGINFREEPNTDSKILKVFSQNAKITILEEQGTWYKIKHNDQEGYVLKEYVSDKKVEVTSRSAVERTTESKTTDTTSTTQEIVEEKTTTTSSKGQEAANYVKQFVGCKYVYGGSTPSGFDCSGLTMYVYKKYGINLSHSATAQSKVGTKVERANLQPGDLVFFKNYRTNTGIGHVGIYIGNNKFVHASTEKTGVITSSLTGSYSTRFVTARRIF